MSLCAAQVFLNDDGSEMELGRGGFGVVLRGTYRMAPVAIKRLKDQSLEQQEVFMREMALLRGCRGSRYIVPFVGASLQPVRRQFPAPVSAAAPARRLWACRTRPRVLAHLWRPTPGCHMHPSVCRAQDAEPLLGVLLSALVLSAPSHGGPPRPATVAESCMDDLCAGLYGACHGFDGEWQPLDGAHAEG